MIETLLLMRHAKSSWSDLSLSDHARPLNARGRTAADAVGRRLVEIEKAPNVIWASDSVRTRETATRLMRVLPGAQTLHFLPDFYHASLSDVLAVMKESPETDLAGTRSLMLLGHNPGWEALHHYFRGRRRGPQDDRAPVNFPTGACAVLKRVPRADSQWWSSESWEPVDFIRPRELPDPDPLQR